MHWSGNFDEIQDFENEIRELFNGSGFMADDVYAAHKVSARHPKAGQSVELDAMAAYVDLRCTSIRAPTATPMAR